MTGENLENEGKNTKGGKVNRGMIKRAMWIAPLPIGGEKRERGTFELRVREFYLFVHGCCQASPPTLKFLWISAHANKKESRREKEG